MLRPTLCSILTAGVLASAVARAAAHDDVPSGTVSIESVSVGLGGKYKVGCWTPVWITLAGGETAVSGRLELLTPDGDGVPVCFADGDEPLVEVAARGTSRVVRYVKFGRTRAQLTVRLVAADAASGLLAGRTWRAGELPAALSSTDELLVGLGPSIGIDEAVKKRLRGPTQHLRTCQIEDPAALPLDWHGYESVHTLIAPTSRGSLLERLDDRQFAALDQWLQLGGRLILCAGARGAELFAEGQRLARLAPGTQPRVVALRQTTGLENFAGATERLEDAGGEQRGFSLRLTTFPKVRGLIEASEIGGEAGRIPTVVRYPYGFGQILFVALDVDQPPFDRWQGRPALVARLLQDDSHNRRDAADPRPAGDK